MDLTQLQQRVVASRNEHEQLYPLDCAIHSLYITVAAVTKLAMNALFHGQKISPVTAKAALAPVARALMLTCAAMGVTLADVIAQSVQEEQAHANGS